MSGRGGITSAALCAAAAALSLVAGCGLVLSYDGYEAAPSGSGASTGGGQGGAGVGAACTGSDEDVEDDGNECTMDLCSAGKPVHAPEEASKGCGANPPTTHCDGKGACVGCSKSDDCPIEECANYACIRNVCQPTYASGATPCGSKPSCSEGILTLGDHCSGAGQCVDSGTVVCSPYACGQGACLTACSTDVDCGAGSYCDMGTASGKCSPKLGMGEQCTAGNACASGLSCADGYCCESECTGTCVTCDGVHTEGFLPPGFCFPVKGGTDPDRECAQAQKCNGDSSVPACI